MAASLLRPADRTVPSKRDRDAVIAALHSRAPRNAEALRALAERLRKPSAEVSA